MSRQFRNRRFNSLLDSLDEVSYDTRVTDGLSDKAREYRKDIGELVTGSHLFQAKMRTFYSKYYNVLKKNKLDKDFDSLVDMINEITAKLDGRLFKGYAAESMSTRGTIARGAIVTEAVKGVDFVNRWIDRAAVDFDYNFVPPFKQKTFNYVLSTQFEDPNTVSTGILNTELKVGETIYPAGTIVMLGSTKRDKRQTALIKPN